ncbi:MAG: 50S ribosomal protein L30 [Dethiobacteria bacterium]|jgi:large subunit ribosomal protein L30|nr:50S ribosomal protein L30 [Bacillota bacterium]
MAQKLRITLVRSPIGRSENQRRTIKALGLNKLNKTVEHNDNPAIRGMVKKISHMVKVTEVE